jgi:hypothetical protein
MCEKVSLGYKQAHELLSSAFHPSLDHKKKKKIPKRVYFCDECQAWHLTSEPVSIEKRRRVYGILPKRETNFALED